MDQTSAIELKLIGSEALQIQLSNASISLETILAAVITGLLTLFAVVWSSRISANASRQNTRAMLEQMRFRILHENLQNVRTCLVEFISSSTHFDLESRDAREKLVSIATKLNLFLSFLPVQEGDFSIPNTPEQTDATGIRNWVQEVIRIGSAAIESYSEQLLSQDIA